MRMVIIALSAALLTGSGSAVAKRDRSIPEASATGEAVSCIPIHQIRESRVRSDKVIDFRVSSKKWYRNTLPYDCPSLGFEERYSYETSLSQLCSTDIIHVLHSSGPGLSPGASCGLGKFQPVEIAPRSPAR